MNAEPYSSTTLGTVSLDPEPSKSCASRRETVAFRLVFVAVLVAGLFVRIELIDRLGLHFDEAMHFVAAKQTNMSDVLAESRRHTHPPIAFLVFHAFRGLGDTETAVRLPSLLFFVTAFLSGFAWLRTQYDRWPALFGVALLCGSLPFAQLSVQMRGYTFLLTVVFSALLLRDRFLETRSIPALVGSTACLLIALFTHYSIALLLLVLGIATLVRLAGRDYSWRTRLAWCGSQLVLLGGCVGLLSHVSGFQNGETGRTLWLGWLRDSAFDPNVTSPVALPFLRGLEFLAFLVGGPAWMVLLAMLPLGWVHAVRSTWRETRNGWAAAERGLLLVLPWVVALTAFALRIYPIGRTRHPMWLLPFVIAAVASALVPFFRRRPVVTASVATIGLATWFVTYTLPPFTSPVRPTDSPAGMRAVAVAIREHVPVGGTLLTDQSTRYQLEFYLAGSEVSSERERSDGFVEHEMDGRRVLVAPVFYAVELDHEKHSGALRRHMDAEGTWFLWINRGFPSDHPVNVLGQCGIERVLESHRIEESWLLRTPPPGNTSASDR